jgi:hypothetical protein
MSSQQTGWSADGNWFWDGSKWNDAISEDGRWRFDGADWIAFQGQRTPMPPLAFNTEPPFAQAVDPGEAMPSWVAKAEIERLQEQQIEQQIAAVAPPPPPLPPELDWRRVGEFMEYHQGTHAFSSWQIGPLSVIIYIVLLWFCTPLSVVFVWLTGWGTTSKVVTTLLSVGLMVFAFIYYATRSAATYG